MFFMTRYLTILLEFWYHHLCVQWLEVWIKYLDWKIARLQRELQR